MAFLFSRSKQRSNADLCKSTKDLLQRLLGDEKPVDRIEEELARNLSQMKQTLQGMGDSTQHVYDQIRTASNTRKQSRR